MAKRRFILVTFAAPARFSLKKVNLQTAHSRPICLRKKSDLLWRGVRIYYIIFYLYTLSSILPADDYFVCLSEIAPKLVFPSDEFDYFSYESVKLFGTDGDWEEGTTINEHCCWAHYILDGHHKLLAAAELGISIKVLSLL